MTSSYVNGFRITGTLGGESTGHQWIPITKASNAGFDVFFDFSLNKRLNKQSTRRWFDTPGCSLCRHCSSVKKPNWTLPSSQLLNYICYKIVCHILIIIVCLWYFFKSDASTVENGWVSIFIDSFVFLRSDLRHLVSEAQTFFYQFHYNMFTQGHLLQFPYCTQLQLRDHC